MGRRTGRWTVCSRLSARWHANLNRLSLRGVEPHALKQMTASGAYCTRASLCLNTLAGLMRGGAGEQQRMLEPSNLPDALYFLLVKRG